MASNNEQYTIPFAIDPRQLLTGLDQMDQGLTEITAKAKGANAAISESFTTSAKASQDFAAKMDAGAKAVKTVSDAAKAVGLDIGNAFSGDNIKTGAIQSKVTEFVAKMKDAAGNPVDFKFNIDQTAVKVLVQQLLLAKGETEAFNLVLASAKDRLAGLAAGSAAFNELNLQIQTAETFVTTLTGEVNTLKEDLATPVPDAGLKSVGDTAEQVTEKFVPLRLQLKQMKVELQEMELAGKAGSQEFIDLSIRAGEVSDQISDTAQRIKNLANDTKGLDAGVTAIRGLAGAFAVGQGAAALFGDQNEEMAKTIAKVQGAMALLQGVQEIANVLNKDSALMTYLATFATKAKTVAVIEDTVALTAETTAIEGETVATVAATTATEGFTAALLLNPVVGIIVLVAALSAALYAYATKTDDADKVLKRLNEDLRLNKENLDQNNQILERSQSVQEANAQFLRKNQSDILTAQHDFLIQEYDNQVNQTIRLKKDADEAANNKKISYDDYMKIRNEYLASFEASLKLESQITVNEITTQRQLQEEKVKLAEDLLKEKQSEATIEIEIAKQAQDFLNQISQARIAELREGQQKEILLLNQSLTEKIQNLDYEQKAKLKALEDQKAILQTQFELADTNGKIVISKQITDFNRQIDLTKQNGNVLKNVELELINENEVAKKLVIKKYAEERADIEFQVATSSLNIQQESASRQIALINLTAQHESDIIERTNQDRDLKDLQQAAIEKKRAQDVVNAELEFALKRIEVEKTVNDDKLKNLKLYFDNSRDAQAAFHLLEAQNELEAAQKAVLALEASDAKLTAQQVADADARVKAAQKAVKDATKDTKAQSLAELLFPDSDEDQRRFNNFISALGEVGKAVDAYTSMLVAQYQKQIDAQKEVVSKDDDALSKLQDQLTKEQDLKTKGYANNVNGIQKEIAVKNKQRDDDVRKQEEYQKKMEAVQRKALILQTAIQAANLITASTKIILAAADLGPVGVGISIVAVAAMLAAFVATQSQAFAAVNNNATTMAEGGIVKGKSHAQGGQKFYSPDNSAGVVELEADEFVTSKRQTEKYFPLLQVINDDKLKHMDDRALVTMLAGLGVHLQTENQHREALSESKEYSTHQINQINLINANATPAELISIDNNLKLMLNRSGNNETVTEEGDFIVTRKGNYTKRVKK